MREQEKKERIKETEGRVEVDVNYSETKHGGKTTSERNFEGNQ